MRRSIAGVSAGWITASHPAASPPLTPSWSAAIDASSRRLSCSSPVGPPTPATNSSPCSVTSSVWYQPAAPARPSTGRGSAGPSARGARSCAAATCTSRTYLGTCVVLVTLNGAVALSVSSKHRSGWSACATQSEKVSVTFSYATRGAATSELETTATPGVACTTKRAGSAWRPRPERSSAAGTATSTVSGARMAYDARRGVRIAT